MAEYNCEYTETGVLGILPCGEVHEYATEEEYKQAYYDELDEIVDELARLEYERTLDFPDDYVFENAG